MSGFKVPLKKTIGNVVVEAVCRQAESWGGKCCELGRRYTSSNNRALCLCELSDGFSRALQRGPCPCSQTLTLKNLPLGQAGEWYWGVGCLDGLWVPSGRLGPGHCSKGRRRRATQALRYAEPCPSDPVRGVGKGGQARFPHEETEAWRG